jgi:hypothetical protein
VEDSLAFRSMAPVESLQERAWLREEDLLQNKLIKEQQKNSVASALTTSRTLVTLMGDY